MFENIFTFLKSVPAFDEYVCLWVGRAPGVDHRLRLSHSVVSQDYYLEAESKNVILGNAVVLRCEVPSFVADFVSVTGWVDEASGAHYLTDTIYGRWCGWRRGWCGVETGRIAEGVVGLLARVSAPLYFIPDSYSNLASENSETHLVRTTEGVLRELLMYNSRYILN